MKYDFDNPQHFAELERQAYDGTIDVSSFPPAAYRYFDSLRLLYAKFKHEGMSKDEALSEKKRLMRIYTEAKTAYENWRDVYKHYQENIRRSGTLLADIEKSGNINDIAFKACEVISLMTGDASFVKRQKKKILGETDLKYYYHPESDCLFTLRYDEDLGDNADSQLCIELTEEEYYKKKKGAEFMKVAVMKTKKSVTEALLDDFFKGDENYMGDAQTEEEERSEHDKHWNANMLVMQYSNENAELRKVLQELVDIGPFDGDELSDMICWTRRICRYIEKANKILGGKNNEN